MVRTLELRCQTDNNSDSSIAKEFGVEWKLQQAEFEELLSCSHGTKVNIGAAFIHYGQKSCLHKIEQDLLALIWEQRAQGLAVSIWMVIMKASYLLADFWLKTPRAKYHGV
jgi:hypothetical protein